MDTTHDDIRKGVYEIGYLIASSVPEEKVSAEADAVRKIITGAGAEMIAEEAPVPQPLAYTMRKKRLSGEYENYDMAYFGWFKFDVGSDVIESVKKAVALHPSVLRSLVLSTVRENTYLGKRAAAEVAAEIASTKGGTETPAGKAEAVKPVATAEDMDKSIDALVKEV
jgi:ribosomal protein S6